MIILNDNIFFSYKKLYNCIKNKNKIKNNSIKNRKNPNYFYTRY